MLLLQPGNQTRFVGAADLLDRIKACNFFQIGHHRAQLLVLFVQGLRRIGSGRAWRRWSAAFFLHAGVLLLPDPEGFHAALTEDRRDLAA